ncbi:hypothetical protein [Croceicoccus sp. BE223]|uniref:hypothetical protein n=1 Tax=Croceicoccus sp. BE223 TaxID=2817716 RepID=UPI00285881FF|nr:hypothetical protein [Croceicoccus sp. BE223]MDR7101466.1 hypothetical protein [Croceicoccus sp. BE223]
MIGVGILAGIRAAWSAFVELPRAVHVALIVLVGVIAAVAWLARHDARTIQAHDAKAAAATSQAVTRADRAAIAADAQREIQRQAASAETREAIDHAEDIHPVEVRRPAGPAVRAAADSLRRRAAASRDAAR